MIRTIGFTAVFLVLFSVVNLYFMPGNDVRNEKAAFYEEPDNSLEVVFCGSSSILRDISPMELYGEYGIAGYSMATTLQAPQVTAFCVKEALSYHDPKVVVINAEAIAQKYNYSGREGQLHTALDPYRFSWDKLQTIISVCRNDEKQSIWDYLFPVVRYHDSWWQGEDFERLEYGRSCRKGYVGMRTSVEVQPASDYMAVSGKPVSYVEESLEYYREAIHAVRESGAQVLVVKLPRTTWTLEEHEALAAFAEENGADFLDFNTEQMWQETGLDVNTDFYDKNHLCHTGAVKLSRVLGQYLKEHYDLTDVRNMPGYEQWDDALEHYKNNYMFMLRENAGNGAVTFSVVAMEPRENLTYQWTVYQNGEPILEQTGTEEQVTANLTGEYYAVCVILDGDVVLDEIKTDIHKI